MRITINYQEPWYSRRSSITSVVFKDEIRPRYLSCWFSGCSSIVSVDLRHLDTSNVRCMDGTFFGCTSLTSLDVSNFDTSNVITMSDMFARCDKLESLDLSSWNEGESSTSNIWDMSFMFWRCTSLTSLDLSGFDTSSARIMRSMFGECPSLTSLDLSSFDITNPGRRQLDNFVSGCSSLRTVTLGENVRFGSASSYGWYLPTPTGDYCTGNWVQQGTSPEVVRTAQQLHDEYDSSYSTLSGTWVAEQEGKLLVSVDAEGVGTDTTFPFTLTLDPSEGERAYTITDASGATVGSGTISGSGTFSLADGQTLSVMLFDGSSYSVTPGTLPDGWAQTSPEGSSVAGIIEGGEDAAVPFSFRRFVSPTARVAWADGGSSARPASVRLVLRANGGTAYDLQGDEVAPVDVSGTGDAWTYSFGAIPRYDSSGSEIAYTVEEADPGESYDVSYDGLTVTNTLVASASPSASDEVVPSAGPSPAISRKALPRTGDGTSYGTGAALAALAALGSGLALRRRREA